MLRNRFDEAKSKGAYSQLLRFFLLLVVACFIIIFVGKNSRVDSESSIEVERVLREHPSFKQKFGDGATISKDKRVYSEFYPTNPDQNPRGVYYYFVESEKAKMRIRVAWEKGDQGFIIKSLAK